MSRNVIETAQSKFLKGAFAHELDRMRSARDVEKESDGVKVLPFVAVTGVGRKRSVVSWPSEMGRSKGKLIITTTILWFADIVDEGCYVLHEVPVANCH